MVQNTVHTDNLPVEVTFKFNHLDSHNYGLWWILLAVWFNKYSCFLQDRYRHVYNLVTYDKRP